MWPMYHLLCEYCRIQAGPHADSRFNVTFEQLPASDPNVGKRLSVSLATQPTVSFHRATQCYPHKGKGLYDVGRFGIQWIS